MFPLSLPSCLTPQCLQASILMLTVKTGSQVRTWKIFIYTLDTENRWGTWESLLSSIWEGCLSSWENALHLERLDKLTSCGDLWLSKGNLCLAITKDMNYFQKKDFRRTMPSQYCRNLHWKCRFQCDQPSGGFPGRVIFRAEMEAVLGKQWLP